MLDLVTRLPVEVHHPASETNFEVDLLNLVTAKTHFYLDRAFIVFSFCDSLISQKNGLDYCLILGSVKVLQLLAVGSVFETN